MNNEDDQLPHISLSPDWFHINWLIKDERTLQKSSFLNNTYHDLQISQIV